MHFLKIAAFAALAFAPLPGSASACGILADCKPVQHKAFTSSAKRLKAMEHRIVELERRQLLAESAMKAWIASTVAAHNRAEQAEWRLAQSEAALGALQHQLNARKGN